MRRLQAYLPFLVFILGFTYRPFKPLSIISGPGSSYSLILRTIFHLYLFDPTFPEFHVIQSLLQAFPGPILVRDPPFLLHYSTLAFVSPSLGSDPPFLLPYSEQFWFLR